MTGLSKFFFLVAFPLFIVSGFVEIVFADPIPMEPQGSMIQYTSIVLAEICGLFSGMAVLTHRGQTDWRKDALILSISLIASYAVGIVIWAFGYALGILVYNSLNPFSNASSHPLSVVVLLLPEFVGTVMGAILIRLNLRIEWKMAFAAMAVAMLTSFLVGLLIVNVYVRI